MARIKVTGWMDVEEDIVDRNDPSGLTEQAYLHVINMFSSLDDVETKLEEDDG